MAVLLRLRLSATIAESRATAPRERQPLHQTCFLASPALGKRETLEVFVEPSCATTKGYPGKGARHNTADDRDSGDLGLWRWIEVSVH